MHPLLSRCTLRGMGEKHQQTGAQTTDQDTAEQKVRELLGQFKTAMLVTRTADGALRARPMAIAETRDTGTVTFITSAESGKVEEIESDPHVAITMQQGRPEQAGPFMAITGTAELERDPREIDRLYSLVSDVWFEGPRDPRIVIIRVHVTSAEYWDQRGAKGIRYAWEAVKAVARGGRPSLDDQQHGVLNLG